MNRFMRGATAVVGSIAVVGVAAGATYAVATMFDGSWEEDDAVDGQFGTVAATAQLTGTAEPVNRTGTALLTSNRDRLAVCVDDPSTAESAAEPIGVQEVNSAIQALSENPTWQRLGLSEPAPLVREICPSVPALYDPGPYGGETLWDVRGRRVEIPSYFRVHVYVLPQEEIDHVGGSGWRQVSEENMCELDNCSEVTTGLYVSLDELRDSGFFVPLFARAVGIWTGQ